MDSTPVLVALIAACPLLVGQYLIFTQTKEGRKQATKAHESAAVAEAIIAGNGRGNVGKMIEDLQDTVVDIQDVQKINTHKITSVLAWQGRHEARHDRETAHKGE